MSLKLFFAPGACSFVPHAMLELAGVPFEPVMVKLHKGEQRSAEYLALNPRGQVPVLVDEGEVVTQILAILLHLDAKFPQAGTLPAAGLARTRALSTLAWMNNTVHPTFTHVFMPQKFTGDEGAQALIRAHAAQAYRRSRTISEVSPAHQAKPSPDGRACARTASHSASADASQCSFRSARVRRARTSSALSNCTKASTRVPGGTSSSRRAMAGSAVASPASRYQSRSLMWSSKASETSRPRVGPPRVMATNPGLRRATS